MFSEFPQSEFDIISKSGDVQRTKGIFSGKTITIPDTKVVIQTGDELRRKLPNNTEEVFDVLDPEFHEAFHTIPAHFQVKVQKKGSFPQGTGGNYTINIRGSNSRVNIHSQDHSTNTVADNRVFVDLRTAITNGVSDASEKAALINAVERMEQASNDKKSFTEAYQDFISTAANHITVVAPLLPALTAMLG